MSRGDPKIITSGDETRAKILAGAKKIYDVAACVYGPLSANVAIQKSYGPAVISHDGITTVRDVFLPDEVEDIGAGLLVEASNKSNDISGDGTTCSVILGYHIMRLANQRIAAGYNPMRLRKGINKAAEWLKKELEALAIPVDDTDLDKVAAISASDPEIGKLVADTVLNVGGVGITVEEYDGLGVIQDMVEGVYFDKGWSLPHFVTDRVAEEAVHENVSVLLVEKKISQNQDIVPILETIYQQTEHKTVLIIGKLDGQAAETCALTNIAGKVKICVVKPPVYGDQELPFLEDVAALTGGKVIPPSLAPDKVTAEFLGQADKVIVAKDSTTIIGGHGIKEDIDSRIAGIEVQLKNDKYSAFQKERMELRLAKLKGKIGIIKVGGATDSERKEMKFRVEDAVHATRAAKEEGIVPGGATTLLRLSSQFTYEVLTGDELEGAKLVYEALAEPFKRLMTNAGEDGGYRLKQVLVAQPNYGFDIKNMTDEPLDLLKAGVIDPVKVLKSVVENACSVAGIAITIPTTITFDREYQLEQVQLNKAKQE